MFNKKAINAGGAANLLIIIALVLVLYILFLPPESREELLGENISGSEGGGVAGLENVLLLENVGTVDYVPSEYEDHDISNFYLSAQTNAEVLDQFNAFIIKRGWFVKKDKIFNFKIDDVDNTNNVILSLSASKIEGVLHIYVNGEEIYEGNLESLTPSPITIKTSLLQENNILEFKLDGVGVAFWKINRYDFTNVEIIGDVTDISGQEGEESFILTEEEYENLQEAKLNFIPYCSNVQDVGKLTVKLNYNTIFSAIPLCEDYYEQAISKEILTQGENKISFMTSKGSYTIEQIEITTKAEEDTSVIYYFEINESQYQEIEDGETDCMLFLEFVDNEEDKKATLNVNGHLREIDQTEPDYEKNLNDWVGEGNNYIEIIPKRTLNIVELKVSLGE